MKTTPENAAALLLRSVLTLSRRVRAERPDGSAGLSSLGILGVLHRLGPMVATRLAAEQHLAPQSLTRIIAELERHQLISRTRSEVDARAITIAITHKGRDVLLTDIAARRAWLEKALAAALTPDERRTLLTAAPIMLKLAENPPPTG